jgi:hypothetical protein
MNYCTIEIDITPTCAECGSDLTAEVHDGYESPYRLKVQPCEVCLESARTFAKTAAAYRKEVPS